MTNVEKLEAERARLLDIIARDRDAQRCEWFALCTNAATQLVSHPILGDVPACDRCAARAKES
jgi:hypothetical protein